MPTPLVRPTNYAIPFAASGLKNTIPIASTGTGKASFTDGFPPVTMQALSAGGIPPEGKDFNGIYYQLSQHTIWVSAGGQYRFDSALSTAIGGYPVGMVLQSNDGASSYVSAVSNNTTDFNSTPSSIGSLWMPFAGGSIVAAVQPVYINAARTLIPSTYLVDTRGGAFTVTLPASPVVGNSVELVDAFGSWFDFNLTINRNGNTIQGIADNLVCNIRGLDFRLIFNGTTWRLQ